MCTYLCRWLYFQSVTHCAKHYKICIQSLGTFARCLIILLAASLPTPHVLLLHHQWLWICDFLLCKMSCDFSRKKSRKLVYYIVLYYLPEAKLHYVTNITCIFFEHWNFLGLDVRESLVFVVNSAEAGRKNSTIRTKRPYHRFSVKSRHAQENLKKYRVL